MNGQLGSKMRVRISSLGAASKMRTKSLGDVFTTYRVSSMMLLMESACGGHRRVKCEVWYGMGTIQEV